MHWIDKIYFLYFWGHRHVNVAQKLVLDQQQKIVYMEIFCSLRRVSYTFPGKMLQPYWLSYANNCLSAAGICICECPLKMFLLGVMQPKSQEQSHGFHVKWNNSLILACIVFLWRGWKTSYLVCAYSYTVDLEYLRWK